MSNFRIGQAVRVVDGDYREADGVVKAIKDQLYLIGFSNTMAADEWIHKSLLSECLVTDAVGDPGSVEFKIGDTVKIIGGDCMGKQGVIIDKAYSPGFWQVRITGKGDWILYRSVLMLAEKAETVKVSDDGDGVVTESPRRHSHYFKDVSSLKAVDVYRVLDLFGVTHPCAQHAIKKLLMAGQRGGGKDLERDVREAGDTINRWLQMIAEDDHAPHHTV